MLGIASTRKGGCLAAVVCFGLALGLMAVACVGAVKGDDTLSVRSAAPPVENEVLAVVPVSNDTLQAVRNDPVSPVEIHPVSLVTHESGECAVFQGQFALPGQPLRRLREAQPLRRVGKGAGNAVRRVVGFVLRR